MNLGVLIRQQRGSNNMTLRELEGKIGMPHPQISRYENGKTGLKDEVAIEILVKGFDIPYSEAKDMVAEFKMKEAYKELSKQRKEELIFELNEKLSQNPDFLNDSANWIPIPEKPKTEILNDDKTTKLAKRMKEVNATQGALARQTGISRTHINNLLHNKNKVTLGTARKIAEALYTTIDEIF